MNQSNCVKSLITKILNTSVQVLKIKWLQRTQESMNNDMLHIHNSSRILIFKFQGMYTQPNAQQSELQKDPDIMKIKKVIKNMIVKVMKKRLVKCFLLVVKCVSGVSC